MILEQVAHGLIARLLRLCFQNLRAILTPAAKQQTMSVPTGKKSNHSNKRLIIF